MAITDSVIGSAVTSTLESSGFPAWSRALSTGSAVFLLKESAKRGFAAGSAGSPQVLRPTRGTDHKGAQAPVLSECLQLEDTPIKHRTHGAGHFSHAQPA